MLPKILPGIKMYHPSMRVRLSIIAIIFISLAVILMSAITYDAIISTLRQKNLEISHSYTDSIWHSINLLVNETVNGSYFLLSDKNILSLYGEIAGDYIPRKTVDELEQKIDEILIMFRQDLLEISILTPELQFPRNEVLPFTFTSLRRSQVFEAPVSRTGRYLLLNIQYQV